MWNVIPVLGWLVSLGVSASMAVPFWACWTLCGIGERYFYFVPKVYQSIPFGHCVGIFIVLGILKCVLNPGALINVNNKK